MSILSFPVYDVFRVTKRVRTIFNGTIFRKSNDSKLRINYLVAARCGSAVYAWERIFSYSWRRLILHFCVICFSKIIK